MRSVIRWDPMRDLVSLREVMDRLVEESFVRPGWVGSERTNRLPLDVYSTSEELVIIASVPGADAVNETDEANERLGESPRASSSDSPQMPNSSGTQALTGSGTEVPKSGR